MWLQYVDLAGSIASVQRAARVHRPPLAPCPDPLLGGTGQGAVHQDTADHGPDLGPGPHPGLGHHLHKYAVSGGETFAGQ